MKLHETDVLIAATIRKTSYPLRNKSKYISKNNDPRTFYIKSNNEVVSHKTNWSLKIHRLRLDRSAQQHHNSSSLSIQDDAEGFSAQDVIAALVLYCNGILPVNILTNSKELAAILNYVIKTNLSESKFSVIPNEAKMNKKHKPKIMVWYLKPGRKADKKKNLVSVHDMISFYDNFPARSSLISVTKQHPYLMSGIKRSRGKKEEQQQPPLPPPPSSNDDTLVSVLWYIDENPSQAYDRFATIPLEYRQDLNTHNNEFFGCPILHVDMRNYNNDNDNKKKKNKKNNKKNDKTYELGKLITSAYVSTFL